jgi:hypothetical protein
LLLLQPPIGLETVPASARQQCPSKSPTTPCHSPVIITPKHRRCRRHRYFLCAEAVAFGSSTRAVRCAHMCLSLLLLLLLLCG